eukprot:scaffold163525_cov28-Tisochrysis_lutea.AAC.3
MAMRSASQRRTHPRGPCKGDDRGMVEVVQHQERPLLEHEEYCVEELKESAQTSARCGSEERAGGEGGSAGRSLGEAEEHRPERRCAGARKFVAVGTD